MKLPSWCANPNIHEYCLLPYENGTDLNSSTRTSFLKIETQSHGKPSMHVDVDDNYNHVTLPDETLLTITKIGKYFLFIFPRKMVRPWRTGRNIGASHD